MHFRAERPALVGCRWTGFVAKSRQSAFSEVRRYLRLRRMTAKGIKIKARDFRWIIKAQSEMVSD